MKLDLVNVDGECVGSAEIAMSNLPLVEAKGLEQTVEGYIQAIKEKTEEIAALKVEIVKLERMVAVPLQD